jgi:hypothetical protein
MPANPIAGPGTPYALTSYLASVSKAADPRCEPELPVMSGAAGRSCRSEPSVLDSGPDPLRPKKRAQRHYIWVGIEA